MANENYDIADKLPANIARAVKEVMQTTRGGNSGEISAASEFVAIFHIKNEGALAPLYGLNCDAVGYVRRC